MLQQSMSHDTVLNVLPLRQDSDLHPTRLHEEFAERVPNSQRDAAGGYIGPSDIIDEKHAVVENADVESEPTPEGAEPNEHEKRTLRRVGENLPPSAYLIAIVELTERFAYYGCQGLFQNYINNRPNGADGPPGLGLGHQGATGLNLFFQWFSYGMDFCVGCEWRLIC
jgi:POT family proton-dependent oligopeptide transporter